TQPKQDELDDKRADHFAKGDESPGRGRPPGNGLKIKLALGPLSARQLQAIRVDDQRSSAFLPARRPADHLRCDVVYRTTIRTGVVHGMPFKIACNGEFLANAR